ncbi:heparinase II/III family protein [Vibrio sp. MA40-2]|uniref:heparinase II/III domain-containing protein n=1 Tax=Vibrio sp. MA40-2 TaxID=3391828 RepID=UPI0039A66348
MTSILQREHDFQVFTSPKNGSTIVNPPCFNWPQDDYTHCYNVELTQVGTDKKWDWHSVQSPLLLDFELEPSQYRWRVTSLESQQVSEWVEFDITSDTDSYLAPTAQALFAQCANRDQFLMYFDEDIQHIQDNSQQAKQKLINSVSNIDIGSIQYPTHYRRGQEEGKRTAIANVRNWIDRDLIALTLLYKIWSDVDAGNRARDILLRICEWSPEGPASLLRPCTWGDEVGLSIARNLYLAYHWLRPILTEEEQSFVRPMLIRVAYQMEQRLEQDQFKQFPGHSHTSRLPAYLGIAALALHKEFDRDICERWLNYALMIYRGVLPFYGGKDGSWVEGPFYSSSYSKWHHPFFLSVERISRFSFYEHPFYKNYVNFAMDFVATKERIHPFGDGYWCQREGTEWPGFFAQNPLRIYAQRYGDAQAIELDKALEEEIESYKLHLLDVIPTIPQLEFVAKRQRQNDIKQNKIGRPENIYYSYAGLGKLSKGSSSIYYRASQFGNSSHRHADQGNFAFVDSGTNVLTPSGSYGYRFGSRHHSQWTRTTLAHNLPLINGLGQRLDCPKATASVLDHIEGECFNGVILDLTNAYDGCENYTRVLVHVVDKGLVVYDQITLNEAAPLQWRLHTPLKIILGKQVHTMFGDHSIQSPSCKTLYQIEMLSNNANLPELVSEVNDADGYYGEIESDAQRDVKHIEWQIKSNTQHHVVLTCVNSPIDCQYLAGEGIVMKHNDEQLIIKEGTQSFLTNYV